MKSDRLGATWLAGALVVGASVSPVHAQTNGGDSIAEKAAVCSACHGAKGTPISKDIPVIWGQHAGYIFIQLRDLKSGARKNEIMTPIVSDMSRADMLALGEYFEAKPWPDLSQPRAGAEVAAHAEGLAASGQCTQCHLGGYLGDSTNPRLAGQSTDYLRKTMLEFHTGTRGNNPWMAALLKTYADADIDALAQYLGGL
ncbi:MAG TPA: hypothetical protein VLI93_05845 [Acetobacteraceae bacterium]|nr:hypothetical protein [Acetobacteraceae bacterium]